MLRYNTQLERLVLPEYGRNIQQMVDHCVTIADREERNRCARTIVTAMGNLFPELRDSEASRHKLWDHLAVMSNFKLDIDWPCEVITADRLDRVPDKIPYPSTSIRLRQYGRDIEQMIVKATVMDPGEERDALVILIAGQMKKQLASTNPDIATDARVFADLADYSHGALRLDPAEVHLPEFQIVAPVTGKKKRKK